MRKLACIAALLLAACIPAWPQQLTPNISQRYLLAAANADRTASRLPPLHIDENLTRAAYRHALEMARHQTISHQFAGEADLASRGGEAGAHFSLITENVAEAQSSAQIHDLWMHSAGHRANLLDAAVDAVGIAVVQDHGQLYAVEDFGRTVPILSLARQEETVASLLQTQGITMLRDATDARATCSMSAGHAGARQPWFVMRFTTGSLAYLPPELITRLGTGKYHEAAVGACTTGQTTPFSSYNLAVLLYP